jgi:hypothetical protein
LVTGALAVAGVAFGASAPANAAGVCVNGNSFGTGASCTKGAASADLLGATSASASGPGSTAFAIGTGSIAVATGVNDHATAIGQNNTAIAGGGRLGGGPVPVTGTGNTTNGNVATAIGSNNTAFAGTMAPFSTNTTVNDNVATAIGNSNMVEAG